MDWDSLQAAFKFSIKQSPTSSLDIVFPGAGIMGSPTLNCSFPPDLDPDADLPEPESGKVIDINFKAVYNTTVLALHYFAKGASLTTNGHVSRLKHVRMSDTYTDHETATKDQATETTALHIITRRLCSQQQVSIR